LNIPVEKTVAKNYFILQT